ncbi:MAG: AAA+ superfamily predicted ATPase [Dokdonia sp.]|jgi:AAA+ superfamily predicted ATPase
METRTPLSIIYQEIEWLEKVIHHAIGIYLQQEGHHKDWREIPIPDYTDVDLPYANSIKDWELNVYERLTVVLALAPHIRPEALDIFFGKNKLYDRGFTEFGGMIDKHHSGFLPTGQTLLFIATSTDIEARGDIMKALGGDSILYKEQVISLEKAASFVPKHNGVLQLNDRWLDYFMTGEKPKITHDATFPAVQLHTHLNWEDLVLNDIVMDQVLEINAWLEHGKTLMSDWGLYKKIKPGYRALFYGPPGTGKTLTVSLLGKASGREVYRVDLSMIVSKYIGETEKNLSKIFDIAQYQDWILFFDEADALFGKRTEANSSNDRHANQQTSYLLQRIEDFPGVVVLASNLKANMDDAFTRRFQSMIHFSIPSPEERFRLWSHAFSDTCTLHPEIDLQKIAQEYELAGGAIINILRFCALTAIKRNDTVVTSQELLAGLRREFKKENKTIAILQ